MSRWKVKTPKTGWVDSEPDTAQTYLAIMNNPADPDFKFAEDWAVLEIDEATAPEVPADAICDQTIAAGPQVGLHPAHEGGGEAKQTQAAKPPIVDVGPFIVRRARAAWTQNPLADERRVHIVALFLDQQRHVCDRCATEIDEAMLGKRIDNPVGLPKPGDYGKTEGHWYACAPATVPEHPLNVHNLFVADLTRHEVVEHEDGSLTVAPSILITRHDGQWHGFLERGLWREC
jgi:hypothetical protein